MKSITDLFDAQLRRRIKGIQNINIQTFKDGTFSSAVMIILLNSGESLEMSIDVNGIYLKSTNILRIDRLNEILTAILNVNKEYSSQILGHFVIDAKEN